MFEQKGNKTMKKFIRNSILIASACFIFSGCDVVNEALSSTTSSSNDAPKLSNGEVISGLKEALDLGIKNAVDVSSKVDGYYKNTEIKIPLPEDAKKVKEHASKLGLESQIVKIEETLNRAAEEAAKEATPIFVDAIKNMTIQDGFAILNGGDGSATTFLKNATSAQLKEAFRPKVDAAIKKVKLTELWKPVMTKYNMSTMITGEEKINPDLDEYVLDKAIDGLFKMVEKEENKIRKDPAARITSLLQKVFGSIK